MPNTKMTVLGHRGTIRWERSDNLTMIQLPNKSDVGSEWAWTIRMVGLKNGGNAAWK